MLRAQSKAIRALLRDVLCARAIDIKHGTLAVAQKL